MPHTHTGPDDTLPLNPVEAGPLPDIIAQHLAVLFCGINPGLLAASQRHHFLGRGNRFWRVIHLAGFTPGEIHPENDREILDYGCGLTTLVRRPTARADQVSLTELASAGASFERKVAHYAPAFVALLGKPAFFSITGQRLIAWGRQPVRFAGAIPWVLPNPSGRSRAFSLDQLVSAYRQLHEAARALIR